MESVSVSKKPWVIIADGIAIEKCSSMRCIESCPTGALGPVPRNAVRIGLAEIVYKKCIAWNWRGCTVCYEACPEKAIKLNQDRQQPQVMAEKCNGCGLCENVCPTSSVRAYTGQTGKGIVVLPSTGDHFVTI